MLSVCVCVFASSCLVVSVWVFHTGMSWLLQKERDG